MLLCLQPFTGLKTSGKLRFSVAFLTLLLEQQGHLQGHVDHLVDFLFVASRLKLQLPYSLRVHLHHFPLQARMHSACNSAAGLQLGKI